MVCVIVAVGWLRVRLVGYGKAGYVLWGIFFGEWEEKEGKKKWSLSSYGMKRKSGGLGLNDVDWALELLVIGLFVLVGFIHSVNWVYLSFKVNYWFGFIKFWVWFDCNGNLMVGLVLFKLNAYLVRTLFSEFMLQLEWCCLLKWCGKIV